MDNILKGFMAELEKVSGIWDKGIKAGLSMAGKDSAEWIFKNPLKSMAIGGGALVGAGVVGRATASNGGTQQVNVNRQ